MLDVMIRLCTGTDKFDISTNIDISISRLAAEPTYRRFANNGASVIPLLSRYAAVAMICWWHLRARGER